MASIPKILFLFFLIFITTAEGGKKKSKDKIVIHVPYKILKHHHTHTKYKVITIPTPKKENTIIYLKEETPPTIKYIPQVQVETQPKPSVSFIPAHQESASALLDTLAKHKQKSSSHTDQQEEHSNVKEDQKPLHSESEESSEEFVPSLTYKPVMLNPHQNIVPNFSFKPMVAPKYPFTPKIVMNHPMFHPSYAAFLPKIFYQPMLHLPQGHFSPKYVAKQKIPPSKGAQDNEAHSSDQVYKTAMGPGPKTTSYKVKEETEEDTNVQPVKHQKTTSNRVPSLKKGKKGKSNPQPDHDYQFRNLIPSHPDYEYEHVGYLIIDGKSKKIVGKNFKDQIHLSR